MEEFLASLQMEEYLDGFLKHGFADIELMMDLTPDQLKDCFAEVNRRPLCPQRTFAASGIF